MPDYRVANEAGLFHEPRFSSLLTLPVFEHLRDVASHASSDPKELAARAAAVAALDKIPTFPAFSYLCPLDPEWKPAAPVAAVQYAIVPSKAFADIGPAKGASPDRHFPFGSAEEAGWTAVADLHRHVPAIIAMLCESEPWLEGHADCKKINKKAALDALDDTLRLAAKAAKRRASQASKLSFSLVDAEAEIMESASFALFVHHQGPDGKSRGGFLDSKDGHGPMARARLFESAAAVARTASSRRIKSWKAVEVRMAISKALDLQGDAPCSMISAAIARRESQDLRAALREADVEQLRARLAELEAAGDSPAQGRESAKPRPRL